MFTYGFNDVLVAQIIQCQIIVGLINDKLECAVGSACVLMRDDILRFIYKESENKDKSQLVRTISGPRYKTGTSRIRKKHKC